MEQTLPIAIPQAELTKFCDRHHIRKLSLFGFVLRDDFGDKERCRFFGGVCTGKSTGISPTGEDGKSVVRFNWSEGESVDCRGIESLFPGGGT